MKKLDNLIQHRLNHYALGRAASAAQIINAANVVLKELVNAQEEGIRAYKFSENTLYISVESSAWAQEIWGFQRAILDHLERRFNHKVKKIIIKHLTSE